ncbi:Zn-dependent peptidase [uncultured virus]|nr:Zn-dependent peptidase [uncultured virus]
MEILKPKWDKNQYKFITLDNSLNVLLISDINSSKAAASLNVNIGYYYEPNDYLGLAHFLEHMLFMGTTKYPNESLFMDFLNQNDGSTNAITADQYTTYYFDVKTEYFESALDMFSSFFKEPLFKQNLVEKEIYAVDSEHSKNKNDDFWRINYMLKLVSNKNHPFHRFSTGNLETLNKENVRKVLINFFNKYYSSNVMFLVVLWNKPIELIEKIVNDKFSEIKNKNLNKMKFDQQPFNLKKSNNNSEYFKLIKLVPISNNETLNLFWQFPPTNLYNDIKPLDYIIYLLAHENKKSLSYLLKTNQYVLDFNISKYEFDDSMSSIILTIVLTEKGFNYIPSILDEIFKYIDIIRNKGINEWIYNEIKTINNLDFEYLRKSEPMEYTKELSSNMLNYKYNFIIYGPFFLKNYNKQVENKLRNFINFMIKEYTIIIISSKKYINIASKKDKWYELVYKIEKNGFGNEFDEFLNYQLNFDMDIPIKNQFIPKKVELLKKNNIIQYPKLIMDDSNIQVWYKKDDYFNDPMVFVSIIFSSNEMYDSSEKYLSSKIYCKILEHILAPEIYYAFVANSKFNIEVNYYNMIINIQSYPSKIKIIIDMITKKLFNLNFDDNILNLIIESLKNNLEDFVYQPAYLLAKEYLKEKTYEKYFNHEDLLESLKKINKITILDVKNYIQDSNIKILIEGNILEKDSNEIIIPFKSLRENIYYQISPIIIKELYNGDGEIYIRQAFNPAEYDSVIIIFYEFGIIKKRFSENWEKKIYLISLMTILMKEKFFDTLRTKEQLGYIVNVEINILGDVKTPLYGISFIIQSNRKTPDFLRKRIKLFIKDFYSIIDQLNDNDIEQFKYSAIEQISKTSYNLLDQFYQDFLQMFREDYLFDEKNIYLKISDKIKKEDIEIFYKQNFLDKNTRKIRIIELYKKIDK